jgi:hypothetical protein
MLTVAVPQAQAGVFISVGFAPPVLPVYVQPALPAPGYIWTPGYWAYGDAGYYWVPGVWVQPPTAGLLWTPGYWGFAGGFYGWHAGYWGPHVGFYGGVNYGFGYGGVGFFGGEWRGGVFAYNSACANFGGVHVTNVYVDRTVIERNTIVNVNHTSFNGPGGIVRQPSPEERQFAGERHVEPTANQMQHQTLASQDRGQLASVNHGRPATMAAANVNQYHQVAQQHAASQPISAADRSAGMRPVANARETSQPRPANGPQNGRTPQSEAARTDRPAPAANQPARNERPNNPGAQSRPTKPQPNREQNSRPAPKSNEKHSEAPKGRGR